MTVAAYVIPAMRYTGDGGHCGLTGWSSGCVLMIGNCRMTKRVIRTLVLMDYQTKKLFEGV